MSKTLQGHRTKLNKKEAPTVSSPGTKRLVTADEELLTVSTNVVHVVLPTKYHMPKTYTFKRP